MGAVELDRQVIERRDFPIVRRGYDPASVDAHLRALAADVEELRREASSRGHESLASAAGTQVQGILEAAQATAETIEREAAEDARQAREAANADALRTREEAIVRSQEHVAAVTQATEMLLARVGTMDTETQTLVESLRSGASQLAGDLASVKTNMSALYDAAAGRTGEAAGEPAGAHNGDDRTPVGAPAAEPLDPRPSQPAEPPAPAPSSGDLDGARLVALNMALNGDSRDDAGRYLTENFDVPDRERLLDEVYAAIEG
jgi:DivIVA domain-containing protein